MTLCEKRDLARFSIKSSTLIIHDIPITTARTFDFCSKSSRVYRTLDLHSCRKHSRSSSKNMTCLSSLENHKSSLKPSIH